MFASEKALKILLRTILIITSFNGGASLWTKFPYLKLLYLCRINYVENISAKLIAIQVVVIYNKIEILPILNGNTLSLKTTTNYRKKYTTGTISIFR